MIASAFQIAGGIQINRIISENEIQCELVFPGDEGWLEAVAAVENFKDIPGVEPYEPSIEDIRSVAEISKLQLVMKAVEAGIISTAAGLEILDGKLPDELSGILEGLTDFEEFEMLAKVKGATLVNRLDPFVTSVMAVKGIPDEVADIMFGVANTPTNYSG